MQRRKGSATRPVAQRDAGPGESSDIDPEVEVAREDWQWVQEHRDQLRERYGGRWIAVRSGKVVGEGAKLSTALKQARELGVERPFVTALGPEEDGLPEVAHWL